MNALKTQFYQHIVPQLQKELSAPNVHAVPRITKIVLNIGVTEPQDPRARKPVIEAVAEQLTQIAGQRAQITRARMSVANFKLRTGDPVGVQVTLRGERMWSFLEKLINVALPRVKDFRGISPTAFDGNGNYNLGIPEQIIFPEVDYDSIDMVRSLQATIVTTAKDDTAARALLTALKMPFENQTVETTA